MADQHLLGEQSGETRHFLRVIHHLASWCLVFGIWFLVFLHQFENSNLLSLSKSHHMSVKSDHKVVRVFKISEQCLNSLQVFQKREL